MSNMIGSNEHAAPLDKVPWSPRPDVLVVKIQGDLDLEIASAMTDHLRVLAAHSVPHLVLDLTDVQFMGARGLQMILAVRNERRAPDRLHLVGVADNRPVRRVLEITGIRAEFADYTDLAELLSALDDGRRIPLGGSA